jgi:hypothetical protein
MSVADRVGLSNPKMGFTPLPQVAVASPRWHGCHSFRDKKEELQRR